MGAKKLVQELGGAASTDGRSPAVRLEPGRSALSPASQMPLSREELIDEFAVCLARRRLNVPWNAYTMTDARADNSAGWHIEFYPLTVVLDDHELQVAWNHSLGVLRAWA